MNAPFALHPLPQSLLRLPVKPAPAVQVEPAERQEQQERPVLVAPQAPERVQAQARVSELQPPAQQPTRQMLPVAR